MGERDYFYSSEGAGSGGSINPQIADQLRGFVPEEKGPHLDVPESPAGGLAAEQTVEEPKIESVVDVPVNMTAEERRVRSADLLTKAMDARGTDPEAVLAQAEQSRFVKQSNDVISPRGELGQQILDAYEEKKVSIAAEPAPETTKASSESQQSGPLRSELHNLEQQIDSAKKSLDQASRDGGEKYVFDRIHELERRQAEIIATLRALEPKPTKAEDSPEEAIQPAPEGTAEEPKAVEENEPGAKQGQEMLDQGIADKLLKIDSKGRYAAHDAEGEAILRAAFSGDHPRPEGTKEETPEIPRAEGQAEPSSEPSEATPSEDPDHQNQEAVNDAPERVVERQKLIEGRARESKVFREIEERIHEKEKIQEPPQKSFLSRAYLFVMRREELEAYNKQQVEYREAQKELKELGSIRLTWVEKESKLYEQGLETGAAITEISDRIASGEASKREQAKAQKLIGKLVAKRDVLDTVFAQEVATRLGFEGFEPVVRPVWEGIDRRPQLSEEDRQAEGREVFDFVDKEREAKAETVTRLQAELTPEGLPDKQEPEGLAKILDKLKLGEGEVRSLRDLSPKAQERFFMEEADGSLAELGTARAMMGLIQEEIRAKAENGGSSENPMEIFQLYTGLRAAKLSEHQAEAQVRNAIDRVSKGESLDEMKEKVVQKIKQTIGERVFLVDSGFEVTAETQLSELALSGQGALSEAVYRGWQDWNALRIMGHRAAHGVINIRRAFNQKFAEIIPESTAAAIKATTLTATLAEIDANKAEVTSAASSIDEIRRTALEQRREILESAIVERDRLTAEQRQKTVDSIIEGMIEMLAIPKQSKDELRRLYDREELGDEFLDSLLEYYQRSKLNLERKRQKAEAETAALAERREWLTGMVDRAAEGAVEMSVDEIEAELAEIDHEISEKTLAIQDRIDTIWRDYRSQIRNLEGQLDEAMYRSVLEGLA